MKMRVICYSKKMKMEQLCDAIAKAQGCRWDALPLAYPCDKERLTVFVASVPHEDLRHMMPEMTKERSANVAFLIDGTESAAKEYIEAAKNAGTNVIENVMYVKCGALSFLGGKMTDEEGAAAVKWVEDLIASLK